MKGNAVRIISRQLTALLILTLAAATVFAQGNQVDLLIQNARVVDGTGSPWFRSDVAINDGRIVDIGVDLNFDASQTIDAAGRVVAPGFIDVHTHVESSASQEGLQGLPRADNYVLDGVTTIVTGTAAVPKSISGPGTGVFQDWVSMLRP